MKKLSDFNMAKKKENGITLFSSQLKKSMVTGLPQIITARSLSKIIVRTAIFIMCIIGFVYQSITFMMMFWEYKTIVNVQVFTPNKVERPSLTICNKWGISTNRSCFDPNIVPHGILCTPIQIPRGEEFFCNCYPRYCKNGKILNIIVMDYEYRWNILPFKERKKFLHKKEDIILSCLENKMLPVKSLSKCADPYYQQVAAFSEIYDVESCFTFNTLIGRPDYILPRVEADGEIWYFVDHRGFDYPISKDGTMILISIHSPYDVINPFNSGFPLFTNQVSNFRLRKIVKKLLPFPYKTNCMDYLTQWRARGGQGPTNLKACIMECRVNRSLAKYGCIPNGLDAVSNSLRCEKNTIKVNSILFESIPCIESKCRPACYEEEYVVSKSFSTLHDKIPLSTKPAANGEMSVINIQMHGMETTVYTYTPKFQDIEAFSYLGGYIGMWLGISLLAVFDFVETSMIMSKHLMRKYLQIKVTRGTVKDMNKKVLNM